MRSLLCLIVIGCAGPKATTGSSTTPAEDTATESTSVEVVDTWTTTPSETALVDTGPVTDLNPPELVLCTPASPLAAIEDVPPLASGCEISPRPESEATPGVSVLAEDIYLAQIWPFPVPTEAMIALGDIDGDFFDDIAVGYPGLTYGPGFVQTYEGVRMEGIVDGFGSAISCPYVPVAQTGWTSGGLGHPGFGHTISVGDANRDGHLDLLASGNGEWTAEFFPLPLGAPDAVAEDTLFARLGQGGTMTVKGFAWGDVDGDGQADLSLSGPGPRPDSPCGASVYTQAIDFIGAYEDHQWATYEASALDIPEDPWPGEPSCSGSLTPALIHDTHGDGFDDVLLGGDRLADIAPSASGNPHGGFVLFDGGNPGPHTADDARAVLYGECGAGLGREATAVGDITGDCRPDVLAGASGFAFPGESARGAVFVLSELHRTVGTVPASAAAGAIIYGELPQDGYLSSMGLQHTGALGDLNQDGQEDLIIGATVAMTDLGYAPSIYIFLGPVTGVKSAADADLIIRGEVNTTLGVVGSAGDVDNDGIIDVMMGGGYQAGFIFSGATLAALLPGP